MIEEFKSEGLTFQSKDRKLGEKLSEEDRNVLRNQIIIRKYLFDDFPEFLGLFNNNINKQNHCIDNAMILLGINEIDFNNFIDVKLQINKLNEFTWTRSKNPSEINSGVSTVGEISEKLVEAAFGNLVDNENFFSSKGNDKVKSYGDFVLLCLPNNLWMSVKSGFSRERLLASGYSNDILGIGFFEDFEEFTSDAKNRNLKKVGFLAIYCPDFPVNEEQILEGSSTFAKIKDFYTREGKDMPQNINGNPFLRKLSSLNTDVKKLLNEKNIKNRSTIGF